MHKILRRSAFAGLVGFATGCSSNYTGSSSPPPPPPPAAQANDVNIVVGAQNKGTSAFSPNPKNVSLNGAATADVRWVNGDVSASSDYSGSTSVTHRVVSDDGTSFDTGDLGGNATSTKSLAAGTYAYHCSIHPPMKGTVVVSP